MAGSERSGAEAAKADLLEGAYYVLTPDADSDIYAYRMLHRFLTALGARVISVSPDVHDQLVAAVSHVPHMAAAALTNVVGERAQESREMLRLAAGGFKDMTRIAAGSPELWVGISLDNRVALVGGLGDLIKELDLVRDLVADSDADALRDWLASAASLRNSLPEQWVPSTAELTEISIPVRDRPGVISEVTTAVGRAGCNIEDIAIDHASEDTALLRLLLTDEGDLDDLQAALEGSGFEVVRRSLKG